MRYYLLTLRFPVPFCAPIISGIGQQANVEEGKSLHLLIGRREFSVFEEVVTCLLDHILQGDKRRLIFCKRFRQSFNGLFNGTAVLACGSLLGLGLNKAIGEDGMDEL